MKDYLLSKSQIVPRKTKWIYNGMALFCMAAPQHTYHDQLKVVAKKLLRITTTKIKQLISRFLRINTSTVLPS